MKRILWLLVSSIMTLSLVVAACGQAETPQDVEGGKISVTEKEEGGTITTTPTETSSQQEVVTPGAETKRITMTRVDGTTVEKMVEVPKYGGTLNLVVTGISEYFDGAMTFGPSHQPFLSYSVLIGGDPTRGPSGTEETDWSQGNFMGKMGFYKPELAEEYEIIDDQTIIFKLRKGVHFALPDSEAGRLVGGREVTADDVVYSFERQWNTPTSYHYINERRDNMIQGATALDKYTFELKHLPSMTGRQLIQSAARVSIYPHEVVEKYGDLNDFRRVVGSGPYMVEDYVPDTSLVFIKNPDYFETDPWFPENQLPYIDKIKKLEIPDTSTRQAALRTGKSDYMLNVSYEDTQNLVKSEPQLLSRVRHNNPLTLVARMDEPELPWAPVEDANAIKVRRAMNLAVDKQGIVDFLYNGQGEVFGWPWPDWPEFDGIFEPLDTYPAEIQELFEYNPEKAKQLLTEAGYPDGFKGIVTCTSAQVDYLAILKDYLDKVGIELEFDVKEGGTYNTMLREKSYPHMIRDINRMSQSPVRYHGARLPSNWNYGLFETEITRAAFEEFNLYLGVDDAKVSQIWKGISQHYLEMVPNVMLPEQFTYSIWWPWLKRFDGASNIGSWHTDGAFYWHWIDTDMKKEMGY